MAGFQVGPFGYQGENQTGYEEYFAPQQGPASPPYMYPHHMQTQPHSPMPNYPQTNGDFSLFSNPLQPNKNQAMFQKYPNPYPKQGNMQKPKSSGFQSIMNQFKTQDGSVDVTKMMNTAGQMVGTVNQVQTMVKGLGGLFKAGT
ncbi:MAG: YppG family protein [Bacillus sp. (in: firmicutes)]